MKHVWKDAEEEFEALFAPFGKRAAVERLTDTAYVRGSTGNNKSIKDAQPADYVITFDGWMSFAEVKSTSKEPSFPFSMISRNQWRAARKVTAAKGNYVFFIRRESSREWYAVPAIVLIDHDAQSIKWTEIDHHRFQNTGLAVELGSQLQILANHEQVSGLHGRSGDDGH
jgi:penicillin-binding protein-related factor A (putative recombinase)